MGSLADTGTWLLPYNNHTSNWIQLFELLLTETSTCAQCLAIPKVTSLVSLI